jgi:hypothetical protein
MPNLFGKKVSPVVMIAGAAVLCLGVVKMTEPDTTPAKKTKAKAKAGSTTQKASQYVEEDYTARFVTTTEPVRNTFRPLVTRQIAGGASTVTPGLISTIFTGGEGNWMYTGMVTVDGVPQALLENRTTGDADFVSRGQRWKNATIGTITSESLTLLGEGGLSFTVKMGDAGEPLGSGSVGASVGPVTVPGLAGTIGSGDVTLSPQPAQPNNDDRQNRRDRRTRGQGNTEEEE